MKDIFSMGELFEKVQMQKVFADGKTFVDCTPKFELEYILQRYEEQKNESGFNLSFFVHDYFTEPEAITTDYISDIDRPIEQHIEMLWEVLTRPPAAISNESLISLPNAYIVPGGRFREIYYWDSYFTMLGLKISKRVDMMVNMINNFSFLIDEFGYIPNGNRSYFLGRSQPPFFSCMVALLAEEKGVEVMEEYLPRLEKEYEFWMAGLQSLQDNNSTVNRLALLPGGGILNHYWDENDTPRPESYKEDVELANDTTDKKTRFRHLRAGAESGWDFSSRWFRDVNDFATIHTTEIIPVDLNCLLFHLEKTIAEAFTVAGNTNESERYLKLAAKRKAAIDAYCWNEEKGFYMDYDFVEGKQKNSFTLAGMFPLFFELASPSQADKVANNLEKYFLQPGGLVTTTITTAQQWDAPNGWAPLQWIAVAGLRKYNQQALASEIAKRWMNLNEKVYKNTGKMMEKYNVVATALTAGGGEYPAQDGFGWTNGVYLAMKDSVRIS